MTITFPLSLPAPRFAGVHIAWRTAAGISRSPFTFTRQVQVHQGQTWGMEVSYPPLARADAESVIAFLLSLNGVEGSFLAGDPLASSPRGTATGTPLVKGASQTGQSLITDGWTAGVTGILKAGDYIQLGSGSGTHLHKVLTDTNSNGSGEATLDIWPRLRAAPADNAAITVSSTLGIWSLASGQGGWDERLAQRYGVQFSCEEYLVA